MAKIKTYALGGRDGMLPRTWLDAIEAPSHTVQGQMLAFATSKAELAAMLTDRGIKQWTADSMVKAARWERDGRVGNTWQLLIDEGVIDPTRNGVYASTLSMVKNSVIIEVTPYGEPKPIARLDHDGKFGGRGLFIGERF